MPQFIAYAITYAATTISASVGGWVAAATGSIAAGGYVSTAVYYGTQLGIYAGLSAAATPKVAKPEASLLNLKQSIPYKKRGFGRYRTGVDWALWEARKDWSLNVGLLHDGQINGITAYFLHDDAVTLDGGGHVNMLADGRYPIAPYGVYLDHRLGLPTETAYAQIIAKMPGFWTTAHRGDGTASLMMMVRNGKLVYQNLNYPNGEPQPSVVLEAQPCYDPRDVGQAASDPSTWVWSENHALQTLTYLMRERGYAWDFGPNDPVGAFNADKWDFWFGGTIDYFIDAANVCDEAVDTAAGGVEARYAGGGEYRLDQPESTVVNILLTSMDGWLSTNGQGGFVLYAGKFYEPTVILTDKHIKAVIVRKGVELENQVNQIVATFTDPARNYNTNETDPWVDDAAIARAGKPLVEHLDLPWVQSHSRARRLAKRRMERHQAAWRGSMTVSLGAAFETPSLLGQRFLRVRRPTGAAVLRDAIIEVTGNLAIDLESWSISFDCISVDPDRRDGWTPAEHEGSTPPPVDESAAEPLEAPVITEGRAWFVESGTGLVPRLSLDVTGPDRGDLTWETRWRLHGLTIWNPTESHTEVETFPDATLQTAPVPAGVIVEAQTRYVTGGGTPSDWSASELIDTSLPAPTCDSTTILCDSTYYTADMA